MSENIKFLLRFALHVFRTCFTEDVIDEAGAVDIAVQYLGGKTQGGQDTAQFTARLRVFRLPHHDEFTQTLHNSSKMHKNKHDLL